MAKDWDEAKLEGQDPRAAADATWAKADPVKVTIHAKRKPGNGQAENKEAAPRSRPTILLEDGALLRIISETEDALLADTKGPSVFQRGGMLAYLHRWPTSSTQQGISRKAGALTIIPASKEWLRLRMAAVAAFARYDGRVKKEVPKDPSLELAASLMSATTQWRFPPLTAIVEAPTLRPDGSVLQRPGYDAASGFFLDPGGTAFPVLADLPTKKDALEGIESIEDVLREFPFTDDVARSVMVAEILTALVRRSLRTAPLFVHDAPVMSSGKTLLADVSSLIATGRSIPATSYSGDEDEERKRITAALMAGDPMILIDNISEALQGDALSAVLTQELWKDRVLGVSQVITLPTCTTWIATGNNITVAGDMSTRVLVCRIDPKEENPEEREFERPNLRAHVLKQRGKLVHAGLTALRAYVIAGRPKQKIKPFGRFEEWSDLVRSALVWLGRPDPCLSRASLTIDDPVRAALGSVLSAWNDALQAAPISTTEIVRSVTEIGNLPLKDALEAALPRGEIKTRSLTWWLKKHKDRVSGGLVLRCLTEGRNTLWRLDIVNNTGQ
jgi:hypothetical protein